MTREDEMKALLLTDAEVTAIVEDRIFTAGEVGVEGIRRGNDAFGDPLPTNIAFDADGVLLPTIFVMMGSILPYGNVRSLKSKFTAVSQIVSLVFMEFRGHEQIDLLRQITCDHLEGERLGRSYPIWWVAESMPIPDSGPMNNSTTLRQDWMVVSTRIAA